MLIHISGQEITLLVSPVVCQRDSQLDENHHYGSRRIVDMVVVLTIYCGELNGKGEEGKRFLYDGLEVRVIKP